MHRNIDIAIVRAFVTVAETGSVTRAAQLLHLTQGAVSQQIGRLEQFSDSPLFIRQGRNLVLAPEGEAVLTAARNYLGANEEFAAALQLPVFRGEVRFGAPYDIIGSYAPAILRRFAKLFPSVRVALICKDSLPLLDDLKAGDIDLVLTTEIGCGKGGETLRLDRLVWVGAKGGEAHRRDPLPLSLGAETCIFRPVAVAALRKQHRDWQMVCEVSNMEPVRATLEADLAIAPLLRHSVPDSLAIIAPDRRLPLLPKFQINLYGADSQGPEVEVFAEHARRCVTAGLVK